MFNKTELPPLKAPGETPYLAPEELENLHDKMQARGFVSPLGLPPKAPEEVAEAFGRDMFRLHGKAWPLMIALASGAAMKAERDAMGDVK